VMTKGILINRKPGGESFMLNQTIAWSKY